MPKKPDKRKRTGHRYKYQFTYCEGSGGERVLTLLKTPRDAEAFAQRLAEIGKDDVRWERI